jgi:chemotaxis signal transduction protein
LKDRRFDWDAAHARLERLQRAVAADERVEPEAQRRILDERALRLSRPLTAAEAGDARLLEVMAFSRARSRYAVDAGYVREALPRVSPTFLPGAPAALVGVVIHRTEVVAVVDVSALLERRPRPAGAKVEGHVLIVETRDACFGLLADDLEGSLTLAEADFAPAGAADGRPPWIRGASTQGISLLDVEALGGDARIVMSDE